MYLERLFKILGKSELADAQRLLGSGQYEECLGGVERFLKPGAEQAAAELAVMYATRCHIGMGRQFEQIGDAKRAVLEYQRALKLNPGYADLHNRVGVLMAGMGEYPKSLAELTMALDINPGFVEAHLNVAAVMKKAGMAEEAEEHIRKVSKRLDLSGGKPGVRDVSDSAQTGRVPDGGAKVAGTPGGLEQSRVQRAVGLISRGNNQAAAKLLKDELKMNPRLADVENLLGVAYGNEDMLDDAVEAFERSLKINPSFVAARINLAVALAGRGFPGPARVELEHILRISASNGIARSLLAASQA